MQCQLCPQSWDCRINCIIELCTEETCRCNPSERQNNSLADGQVFSETLNIWWTIFGLPSLIRACAKGSFMLWSPRACSWPAVRSWWAAACPGCPGSSSANCGTPAAQSPKGCNKSIIYLAFKTAAEYPTLHIQLFKVQNGQQKDWKRRGYTLTRCKNRQSLSTQHRSRDLTTAYACLLLFNVDFSCQLFSAAP